MDVSFSDVIKICTALSLSYCLGSLNTSILVAKLYGKDIRNYGSRSAGLTNSVRVLGAPAGLLVLIGDVLKGVIACLIGLELAVYSQSGPFLDCLTLLAAGVGVVLGHVWPVFFGFKGGKGALIAVTVMFMLNWSVALISFSFFLCVVLASRYVSLGTVCATVFFVVISYHPVFGSSPTFNAVSIFLATVIVVKHRENIRRLLTGTENQIKLLVK